MEKFVYSFLKNTYLFELATTVKRIHPPSIEGQQLVVFNDSIYHPQGGGQPNDKGEIIFEGKQYPILGGKTNRQNGEIDYKFSPPVPGLQPGAQVLMKIDKEFRLKHAQLHSAGHIIDIAVSNLKMPWKAGKGYHFEDSPYVEYVGQIQDAPALKIKLQQQINKVLSQSQVVHTLEYDKQQALKKNLIDQTFPSNSVRVIKIIQQECACGGTHISNTNEVKNIQITKVAKKSKNVRVSYKIQ